MQMDQNTMLSVMGVGFFITIVLPVIIGLKVFTRPAELQMLKDEFANFRLHVAENYIKKEDLHQFKEDIDKKLDAISSNVGKLFDLMNFNRGA